MTDLQFFNYLISNCGDLHETAAITIQASMVKLYDEAKGITQYINMLEEAQAQAERAALSTSNNSLVAISKCTMLGSNDYPQKTKRWNKLDPASYKWYLWKPTCQEVYIANRRESNIRGSREKLSTVSSPRMRHPTRPRRP